MIRSPGATGFSSQSAPVASPRLIDVVAASLALGALSLCLVVTITVLSIKVSTAMPIPAYFKAISFQAMFFQVPNFPSHVFPGHAKFSRNTTMIGIATG